jgi:hypothetical protein
MSEMPTIDEFPRELGELLKLLMKLSVTPELAEQVIEDAVANELLYRFSHQANSDVLQYKMKTTIQVWCDIVFELTGWELQLEEFTLK